jgi:poly-gamma-glutamate capsule biosynthesis protein CapA/YwtB (metallophosphatase superfamily)
MNPGRLRNAGRCGALLDSIRHAREAGIAPVGVGADLTAATAPAVVERGGWRFAVLGFGGVAPSAEWLATPRPDDIGFAAAMIEAGADGIFGHHQHRLGPLGVHRDRPIAWGLGNFVWPRLSEDSARTAVAQFVVEPDGAVRGCLLPAVIAAHGHPELTRPRDC